MTLRRLATGGHEEQGMIYELYGDQALVASTSDAGTALLLAREWLREPELAESGTHTCVVQIRENGLLVGEHIVALAAGPLGRR